MTTPLERIAKGLTKPTNPYSALIVAILSVIWGLWLIAPWWDVFSTAPLFSKMLDICQYETIWGALAVTAGTIISVALYMNRMKLLILGLGVATWHWFLVASMMWWGDWQNTGGWTYSCVCISAAYLYLNLRHNRGLFFH